MSSRELSHSGFESARLIVPAVMMIHARCHDHSTVRPHSALGCLTPEEFKQLRPNGECEKQREEPEVGAVLDASSLWG